MESACGAPRSSELFGGPAREPLADHSGLKSAPVTGGEAAYRGAGNSANLLVEFNLSTREGQKQDTGTLSREGQL